MTRRTVILWLVVCASVALYAGQAAHHWVNVAGALHDQRLGQGSPTFWHTYLRFYDWGVLACVAVGVGLASVGGIVLRSQPRGSALTRNRLIPWLVLWTIVVLLCGVTARHWLMSASRLAAQGLITPAFWDAYLQFHQWAGRAYVAVLLALAGVAGIVLRFRRESDSTTREGVIGTTWLAVWVSIAIGFSIRALLRLTLAEQLRQGEAGLGSSAVWEPYLGFHQSAVIAYVALLVGLLGVSLAFRRVVTMWPFWCNWLAFLLGIAAWNAIYVTRMMSFSSVIVYPWFVHLYIRFQYWASLSAFASLVALVGAGAALLYAIRDQQQPKQPSLRNDDHAVLPPHPLPHRPLGVTVLGCIHLISGLLGISSLLLKQSPHMLLAIPLGITLGSGFLGQTRWGWELGMLYFGSIATVPWVFPLFGATVPPWFQGSPVVGPLLLIYLWSARRAFV